eukprot:8424012-Prorocentrum_lima.AAC.1
MGIQLSASRVNWAMKNLLKANLVKAETRTLDSLTEESALLEILFLDEICRASPVRLKFYDQSNV